MCGFLGEFTFSDSQISELHVFEAILLLSQHRGPDHTGTVRGSGFQLGFNRLAILDVSDKGNQPKQSPNGRYNVVFNGEIYNYKDLAKTYNLKQLNSTSDTEVLIHLLDLKGIEETIKLLNGMFAIAIIDTQSDALYLARDFAGIKPLFYGLSQYGVVMASQFDQVYKHSWFKNNLEFNTESVKDYFGLGYMQAPNTIYKRIFQVNPGEIVEVRKDKSLSKTTLVSFSKSQHNFKTNAAADEMLKSEVSRQLVSDVPIATFLSGGIDSPLISAYAKAIVKDIEAFTLKVDNPKFNESDIAKAYADHLKIKQHIVAIKEIDLRNEIDTHFKAFSEPFGDYSSIPTYVISKEAKKKHTVMLSGDGGDELFFGYPRMLDIIKKRWWFKLPYVIRKPLAQFTNKLGITKTWAPYFRTFNAFVKNKHLKISEDLLSKAFENIEFSKPVRKLYTFKNNNKSDLLHQLRYHEFYGHMQRVLIKVDRASMANSLEVRVPFLGKKSIEYAWQQKGSLNIKEDLKKSLKLLLAQEVPKSLINKNKMGFSVPLSEWLHMYLKNDVIDVVCHQPFYGEAIMDVDVFKAYVEDFFENKHKNAWGVWHIYAWQKWWLTHGID